VDRLVGTTQVEETAALASLQHLASAGEIDPLDCRPGEPSWTVTTRHGAGASQPRCRGVSTQV